MPHQQQSDLARQITIAECVRFDATGKSASHDAMHIVVTKLSPELRVALPTIGICSSRDAPLSICCRVPPVMEALIHDDLGLC